MTVTAKAFNFDIWGKFAIWTKEIFHFTDTSGASDPEPSKTDSVEYQQLREALSKYGITAEVIPSWLPNGYKHKDIMVMNSPFERSIMAIYENNNVELIITIRQVIGGKADQVEKTDDLLETYVIDEIEYYIFSNMETLQTAWIYGEFECQIVGKITIEEMKAMIDSI